MHEEYDPMSMTLYLLLLTEKSLNTNVLNDFAKKTDPIAVYAANVDLSSHSGFLPVFLGGVKTGVETYKIPYSEISAELPPNKGINPKATVVIQLRWGGNIQEGATALYTAALLSATYNGVAFDPSSNKYLTNEQLKQEYLTFMKYVN